MAITPVIFCSAAEPIFCCGSSYVVAIQNLDFIIKYLTQHVQSNKNPNVLVSPPDNTEHTGTYPGTPLYTQLSTWDGLVRTGGVPSTTLQMFAGRPKVSD